jgi:hypothetical protein
VLGEWGCLFELEGDQGALRGSLDERIVSIIELRLKGNMSGYKLSPTIREIKKRINIGRFL